MTPTKILKRIEHWESKGLPKMRSTKTKTWKETVEKIQWTIDGSHVYEGCPISMPQFKTAVDNHATQCFSPGYQHLKSNNLKKATLSKWIFNPFAPGEYRTSLKACMKSPPPPRSVKYPKAFDLLINLYLRTTSNGTKSLDALSSKDISNLSFISNRLGDYNKNYLKKVNPHMGGTKGVIEAYLNAAMNLINDDLTRMDTALLCRKWVWEKFPNYLDQKGYLMSPNTWSIYDY